MIDVRDILSASAVVDNDSGIRLSMFMRLSD